MKTLLHITLIGLAAMLALSCGSKVLKKNTKIKYVDGDGNSADSQGDGNGDKSEGDQSEIALRDLKSSYGIRSFEQINETMSVVTGVTPSQGQIPTIYAEVKAQLPGSNDVRSFLASQQVGISKLAVEYCDVLIDSNALRSAVVPGYNFAATPSSALNANNRKVLINGFVNSFWGQNLTTSPNEDASSTLDKLVSDLVAGENMNSAAVTTRTAKGVCAAVLAASPVTIF